MLAGDPPPSPYDLRFMLLGIPVRIQPMFWLVALILGANSHNLRSLLIWVLAVSVAILFHELGHAVVARAFGFQPWITLYGMGGLTSYNPSMPSGARRPGHWGEILISLAGPMAGFLLAALVVVAVALACREPVEFQLGGGTLLRIVHVPVRSPGLAEFIWQVLYISIIWGFVNLLPIFPLDGGQIAREILVMANPSHGLRQSLTLSVLAGGLMAVVGLVYWRDFFVVLLFGYLAYSSYLALQGFGRH